MRINRKEDNAETKRDKTETDIDSIFNNITSKSFFKIPSGSISNYSTFKFYFKNSKSASKV